MAPKGKNKESSVTNNNKPQKPYKEYVYDEEGNEVTMATITPPTVRLVSPPLKKDDMVLLAGCVAIEKKTFPKHESMSETLRAEIEKRVNRWLVATLRTHESQEEVVVGYLIFSLAREGASILKVVVDKQYRRQGIGRMLLVEAENQSIASHVHKMRLHVDPEREYAVELYRSIGME
eukprot:Ihof_evm2s268 gene=Ihof_evmTU2s268